MGNQTCVTFPIRFAMNWQTNKESGGINIERNGNNINFLPFIDYCTADLPAKAEDWSGIVVATDAFIACMQAI